MGIERPFPLRTVQRESWAVVDNFSPGEILGFYNSAVQKLN